MTKHEILENQNQKNVRFFALDLDFHKKKLERAESSFKGRELLTKTTESDQLILYGVTENVIWKGFFFLTGLMEIMRKQMTEQRGSKCELVLLLVKVILGPAAWFQESFAVALKKKRVIGSIRLGPL